MIARKCQPPSNGKPAAASIPLPHFTSGGVAINRDDQAVAAAAVAATQDIGTLPGISIVAQRRRKTSEEPKSL